MTPSTDNFGGKFEKSFFSRKAEKFWEVPFQSENRTDLFIRSALSQPTTFNFGDRLQFLVKKRPAAECATRKVIALSCQKFGKFKILGQGKSWVNVRYLFQIVGIGRVIQRIQRKIESGEWSVGRPRKNTNGRV